MHRADEWIRRIENSLHFATKKNINYKCLFDSNYWICSFASVARNYLQSSRHLILVTFCSISILLPFIRARDWSLLGIQKEWVVLCYCKCIFFWMPSAHWNSQGNVIRGRLRRAFGGIWRGRGILHTHILWDSGCTSLLIGFDWHVRRDFYRPL